MNRFLISLYILLLTVSTDVFSADVNKNINADAPEKVLVVYYSRTGNTQLVAEIIALALKAEVRRIEEGKERKGFISAYLFGGYSAIREKCSDIKPMDFNLEGYDLIFLGSPVWALKPAPAVNAFVSKANFKNKKVVLFFTMGGTNYKKAADILTKTIEEKGGIVKSSFGIQSGKREKMFENTRKSL